MIVNHNNSKQITLRFDSSRDVTAILHNDGLIEDKNASQRVNTKK